MTEQAEQKTTDTTSGVIVKTLTVQGKQLTIQTMGFKTSIKFIAKATTILHAMYGQIVNPFQIIQAAGDELCSYLSLATGLPEDFFDTITADEGIAIIEAVWEVNKEQFVKKLGPLLTEVLVSMKARQELIATS